MGLEISGDGSWLVGAALALIALLAGVPSIKRGRAKVTVDFENATLALVNTQLEIERKERRESEARCDERLVSQDRQHATATAELRGKIDLLSDQFVKATGSAVATKVIEYLDLAGNGAHG